MKTEDLIGTRPKLENPHYQDGGSSFAKRTEEFFSIPSPKEKKAVALASGELNIFDLLNGMKKDKPAYYPINLLRSAIVDLKKDFKQARP